MERQPVSKLAEIQRRDTNLGALIDKRQSMLQSAPSWNITREDPDIEAAARNHARILVEETIPGSISRLEQRRMDLRAERTAYIQEHAPELVAQAQAFESDLSRERRTVERLSRDLQRGFTTQEVIDRRTEALQSLESRKETDLDLQAGFELLSQQRQVEADREVFVEAAPRVEEQISTRAESEAVTVLPPLLQRLRPITFKVENSQPATADLVDHQLRAAKRTEEGQLTDAQRQLLEDTAFIEGLSTLSEYRRVLTPEELHKVVTQVRKYIKTSPGGEKTELSLDFQRRVVEFAGQYTGYSGKVAQKDVQKAQTALKGDNAAQVTIDRVNDFAETASIKLRSIISSPTPNQSLRIKVDNMDPNQTPLYQAALDLASYDVYRERNTTPQQKNLESWQLNKDQIGDWHTEARDLLVELRQNERVAALIDQLEDAISSVGHRAPSEQSDKYALGKAISVQLRIGHLVDGINSRLAFIQAQEVVRAELPRDEVQVEILSGDAIPSLLPQLDHITSMHEHKYNLDNTAGRKAQEAQTVEPENRTPEQHQLLEDMAVLAQFTISEGYKDVFSPDEVHQLVVKLQLLSQKNRPDFNEVEDKILGLLEDKARMEREDRSDRLVGATKRADRNTQNHKGMQWDTLKDFAGEASGFIQQRMIDRYSVEMRSYFVLVQDPQPRTSPDLTEVYQVVADMHALDVIGQRSIRVDSARQESFVANCQVINDWYTEASQVMASLPDNPQVRLLTYQLREMVKTMNIRLEGKQNSGFNKDYRLNPAGAISLQKRIGHTVEQLKAQVNAIARGEVDEGIIVPLE